MLEFIILKMCFIGFFFKLSFQAMVGPLLKCYKCFLPVSRMINYLMLIALAAEGVKHMKGGGA